MKISFITAYLILFLYSVSSCSCPSLMSVIKGEQPFDSFPESDGSKLPQQSTLHNQLMGKSIKSVFRQLGPPDYQCGWMQYLDVTHVSLFCFVAGDKFDDCTIPIKSYAWHVKDHYIVCHCSYNDIRFVNMPVSLTFDSPTYSTFEEYPMKTWLTYHSGDSGFKVILTQETHNLKDLELSFYQRVDWIPYQQNIIYSLYEYYISSYSFWRLGNYENLSNYIKVREDEIIGMFGEPSSRQVLEKRNLPADFFSQCWLVYDKMTDYVQMDRYRFSDAKRGESGEVVCVFNVMNDVRELVFAYSRPDVLPIVQY